MTSKDAETPGWSLHKERVGKAKTADAMACGKQFAQWPAMNTARPGKVSDA
jgi:hypothetical protein